jgi:hypothetical protein
MAQVILIVAKLQDVQSDLWRSRFLDFEQDISCTSGSPLRFLPLAKRVQRPEVALRAASQIAKRQILLNAPLQTPHTSRPFRR